MFGTGHIWELVLVLVIALVFFGPKRLPEIGGAVGKSIKEFKKGATELEDKIAGQDTPEETTTVISETRDEAS
jgi:sec-independent protein translocase protein TatA